MPTIEIGEFDKVFIIRRKTAPPWPTRLHQVTNLSEDALVITAERAYPESGNGSRSLSVQSTKVYSNGSQVGLIQDLRIEASSGKVFPGIEFSILSPDSPILTEGVREVARESLNNLSRLLPEVVIREVDLEGELVREHGVSEPTGGLPYKGPRPSRFERVIDDEHPLL
jgi:hypothetical protein